MHRPACLPVVRRDRRWVVIDYHALSSETKAAIERCEHARQQGNARDHLRAWERVRPGEPLPDNLHAVLAAIVLNDAAGRWLLNRMRRRSTLIARIIMRVVRKETGQ
jgi:hypothetical protein